jgi:putative FmdB family regulatory protein
MPIYVYKCEKCGEKEEKLMPVSSLAKPSPHCPVEDCGGATTRVPSSTSFQLKGGGWFKDSYPD